MLLRTLGFLTAAGATCLILIAPPAAPASHPLVTGISDDNAFRAPQAPLAFARTRKAGARIVRFTVQWDKIAPKPGYKTRPRGFDPSNPADPQYSFAELDREVQLAVANGLEPILAIHSPPRWAQDVTPHPAWFEGYPTGPYKPSPAEISSFAHALAVRYGGGFEGLPRVRYWQLWNEPNLISYLNPQVENGKPFAPGWYRDMLNAFATAIHGVHQDNLVIAGGVAPFHVKDVATAPLDFLRLLLCMSGGSAPKPTCSATASFDVLAVHPYTSGGPTHRASSPGDLEIGNLPDVNRLLAAAVRAHHIQSSRPVQLWVTEFAWDTQPPDPNPLATPLTVQARWTAEALYQMWKSNVRVVTWFLLRDLVWPDSFYQSGLYFRSGIGIQDDVAKPTLDAFRFPFVDYRRGTSRFVWGRTPAGVPARVIVEQRLPRRWKRLATIRTGANGIFSAVLHRKIVQPKPPAPPLVRESYKAAVMRDRPASYWRLDDRSGTTARDLAGTRGGSVVGGVTFGAKGALLNDSDTAACFDGKDGQIDLGPMTSPASVELWVKTNMATEGPFFSNRTPLQDNLVVDSFLHLPHVQDSAFFLLGGHKVANNHWHQVVYTYSGITGRIYLDGVLRGVDTLLRSTDDADAYLGFDPGVKTHLKGCLDEVSLYDHPLTAGQIRAHYLASGRPPLRNPDLGALRARLIGSHTASIPFPLEPPPERYVLPFGG